LFKEKEDFENEEAGRQVRLCCGGDDRTSIEQLIELMRFIDTLKVDTGEN